MMEQGYTTMTGSQVSDNVFINTNGQFATYTNQGSDNYLTPASPVIPQPPVILPSRPAFLSSQRKQPNGEPMQRVDSGIDTDSQRSPISSTSTVNPRNSVAAVYEYINPNDVYLEPSTNGNNRSRQGESSDDAIGCRGGARRRFNPMYEALEKSATQLYAQTCRCKTLTSTQRQLRYLWCALIVIIIVTIFLLGVIAYMLFFLVPSIQEQMVLQDDRVKYLKSRYIHREGLAVGQTSAGNYTALEPQLFSVISELNVSVNSLASQLMAVNTSLQDQLLNISLTPGPQGPSGAGNLSGCYYVNRTSTQALPGIYSTTSWQPEQDILKDYIVMSATCGVSGGDQQFVETNTITRNVVQFRCHCDGEMPGYDYRECRLHLILCPRFS